MYEEGQFNYSSDCCPLFSNLIVSFVQVVLSVALFLTKAPLCGDPLFLYWTVLMTIFNIESFIYIALCIYVHKRKLRLGLPLTASVASPMSPMSPTTQAASRTYEFLEKITIYPRSFPFIIRIMLKFSWRIIFSLLACILLLTRGGSCGYNKHSFHVIIIMLGILDTIVRLVASLGGGLFICLQHAWGQVKVKLAVRAAMIALRPESVEKLSTEDKEFVINDVKECSVCLNTFDETDQVNRLKCDKRHVYHYTCLKEWVSGHHTCPLCREPIA